MWENCHDYNPEIEKSLSVKKKERIPSWVGVDLDSTLAEYDSWKGPEHIGPPIYAMVELVKDLIRIGMKVKIFTARVSDPDQKTICEKAIKDWCKEYIGQELEVTCIKDMGMALLIDDRAIQAGHNDGTLVFRNKGLVYNTKIYDSRLLPIHKNKC